MFKIFVLIVAVGGVPISPPKEFMHVSHVYETWEACEGERLSDLFKSYMKAAEAVLTERNQKEVKLESECKPWSNQ